MNKPNRVALSEQPCRNPMEGVLPSPVKPETLMDNRMRVSHGQQAAVMQRLHSTQHLALHSQLLKKVSQQWPLHPIICRFQSHNKPEAHGTLEASVLINNMLQIKCLMHGDVL